MSTGRFMIVLLTGVGAAAVLLAMASLLDAPLLYVPAMLAVLSVFVAREFWKWDGDLRGWLLMCALLLAVVGLAFLTQKIAA